jgi:hypothetical protein
MSITSAEELDRLKEIGSIVARCLQRLALSVYR